jgi:hypothetical protein
MRVYLAGPINACTDEEANAWRNIAQERIVVECLNPMVRDYRGVEDMNAKKVVEGDKADIHTCNIILANCPKPSVGTSMEVKEAHDSHIYVVVVAPKPWSPWLVYHANFITTELGVAIKHINEQVPKASEM